MNLVEKWAWELGLCEDAFNGRAGSSGNWIVYSVVRGKVKARHQSSAEDDFFFSSSDTPPIELHYRCEQTQTQQVQYNEFSREAGLRTGTLWGRLQRSGRIVGELDRLQRGWGEGQGSSSVLGRGWFLLLLFWYSINRTSLRLSNYRPPLCEISLVIYLSVLFILAVHLSIAQIATWVFVPSSASFNLLWVVVVSMALFGGHSLINAAKLPAAGIQCGGDRLSCNGPITLLP